MCGRYATSRTPVDLDRAFAARLGEGADELEADYNMAPTKPAPIVIARARDDEPPERELLRARWGLVPSWAKDPKVGNRMINARAETVAEKPSFKRAFGRRRALVPADGYYEWYASESPDGPRTKAGKPLKQPFYITPKDREVMAMAGLYEFWRASADDAWLITFTIITTTAEDELGHLHDRMPLLVEPDARDAWLDPSPQDPATLLDLLVPAAPGRLDAFPVSREVNDVRNNGPELVLPIDPEA